MLINFTFFFELQYKLFLNVSDDNPVNSPVEFDDKLGSGISI